MKKIEAPAPVRARRKEKPGRTTYSAGDNWFRRQKILVTWVLAFVFGITSVGVIVGIRGGTSADRRVPHRATQSDAIAADIEHWEKQIISEPGNPLNLFNLGYSYQKAAEMPDGKFKKEDCLKKAEESYRKALEIDPKFTLVMLHMGEVYASQKKNKEAIKILEKGIRIEPDNIQIREKLNTLYLASRDFGKLEKNIEDTLRMDPGNLPSHICRAQSHLLRKEKSKALESFKTALEIAEAQRNIVAMYQIRSIMDSLEKPSPAPSTSGQPEPSSSSPAVTPSLAP